jgi:hypothetical protein
MTILRASALLTAFVSLLGFGHRAVADDNFGLPPGTRLGTPINFRQLTVFPVVQTAAAADKGQYLTLTEGLAKKSVHVSELPGGGSVNTLLVRNDAARPLLILGGEVVLGGKQDRILGQDTIVPVGEELRVQVFCVEHGRWNGHQAFSSAQGMVDGKIRYRAKYGADQSQVWAEVAKKNGAHGVANPTGTYRNLAAGDEGKKVLAPYRSGIGDALGKIPDAKKLVGVVAAVNGRVTRVELFARPDLFASYREKILDSIYMGAQDVPVESTAAPAKPAAISEFMGKARAAKAQEVAKTKASVTVEHRGDGVVNSRVSASPSSPPVYDSYQAAE